METLKNLYDTVLGCKPKRDPSPMEMLPQDVLVHIIQRIDNLRSLRAAILASSAVYDAFKSAKIETLARVVSRSRPRELQSDAECLSMMMFLSRSRKAEMNLANVPKFIPPPQTISTPIPRDSSSSEILHFHWFVEYFTEKLFKSAMRRVHKKGWLLPGRCKFRRLSYIETARIQRALYALEMWNRLLHLSILHPSRETWAIWIEQIFPGDDNEALSVWEIEEFCSVMEMIYERLEPLEITIQRVVKSCKFTEYSKVGRVSEWLTYQTTRVKNMIMTNELATMFKLLSKPNSGYAHQKIREIITEFQAREVRANSPQDDPYPEIYRFWETPIQYFSRQYTDEDNDDDAKRKRNKLRALLIDSVHHPQEGLGRPNTGWTNAYREQVLELEQTGQLDDGNVGELSLFCQNDRNEDRSWGYCLWDQERLDGWKKNAARRVTIEASASSYKEGERKEPSSDFGKTTEQQMAASETDSGEWTTILLNPCSVVG